MDLIGRHQAEAGMVVVLISYGKGLAKLATDLDKPRGFSVIGRGEVLEVLGPMRVSAIWRVGPALDRKLEYDGIRTIANLRELEERWLISRYGAIGRYLHRFSRGQDDRRIQPDEETRSVSAETTFGRDLSDLNALATELRGLCERVSSRTKAKGLLGRSVVLKLKTAEFRSFTRSRRLDAPTQLAEEIRRVSLELLEREVDGRKFRLIGVGCTDLADATATAAPDLFSVQLPPAPAMSGQAAVAPPPPRRDHDLFGNPIP